MLTERVAPSVEPPRGGAASLEHLSDAQLLTRFFQAQEDAAFTALLARHGGMVYNVCRRVLSHASDAEDAFQAAFLVLVRKGATLRQPSGLASWLYGVAYRTARKVKARAAVRTKIERKAVAMQLEPDVNDLTLDELRGILDEEIGQLPEKYALPLVLCYLEGKTNAQAATQLGWPDGSISRRLSRARELLRTRLAKRGLALSVALIAAAFARPASAVPPELAVSTVDAGLAVAFGAPLEEVVSGSTAAVARDVLADLPTTGAAAVPAALVALILVLASIISWQLGAPAYAAQYFLPVPEAAAPGAGCCAPAAGCAHSP
jgi:RNA polymerase sigma factor (sigma-70 family)